MAKKQKSFADKASGRGADADAVMVKYVKSVKSEKTGFWRFNEQMVKLRDGEDLNAALKRLDEASNLVDIDLSAFEATTNTDDISSAKLKKAKNLLLFLTLKAKKNNLKISFNSFYNPNFLLGFFILIFWRGGRVAEGARLESV